MVRECPAGFVAFASGDDADYLEDRYLSWDDVQAWRMDWEALSGMVRDALGLDSAGETGSLSPNGTVAVGFCRRGGNGARKPVLMCLPQRASEAVNAARGVSAIDGGGCMLMANEYAGVRETLAARGMAEVLMVDCLRLEDGRFCGDCGMACVAVARDMRVDELRDHLDGRLNTLGMDYASVREENERLKRDLAAVLSSMAHRVEPEYFLWIFTILGTGSVSAAARTLKVNNSTFDSRLKKYTARGGVYKILYSMTAVRRKGVGTGTVERFNEMFAKHQVPAGVDEADTIRELLNGLEDMNDCNWDGMRDELIEIAKEAIMEK